MLNQPMHTSPLHYAGNITAVESFEALKKNPKAVLLDARTKAEWSYVGVPDENTFSNKVIYLSWRLYPFMQLNEDFIKKFERQVSDKTTPVYIMCKAGGRSREAATALTSAGYTQCYNVIDGFEGAVTGETNAKPSGWKQTLPWKHL